MRKIVFASHNPNKVAEIRQMLPPGFEVLSLDDIGCVEDIPETADTLKGNAYLKASFVKERYGFDCFADDTGLEVDALNGAPGVWSARFAGPGADARANMEKLLGLLTGAANRKARFRTVIALALGENYHYFEGVVEGEILREQAGEGGFGYDPVFRPAGYPGSFAQMTPQEKNLISHRGVAFRKFRAFMGEIVPRTGG